MSFRVLLFSQRQLSKLVAYCLAYEFEDVFAAVTDAQRIDATDLPGIEFSRRAYKLFRLGSGSTEVARRLTPHPRNKVLLEQDFELFFPVFSHSYELYSLAMLPNWRQRSRKAACFINEIGTETLPRYLIELLSEFDHVFLGNRYGVDELADISGTPCTYLPLAVDVLRFTPTRPDQLRPIEICNIGRRSPVTHKSLLERAERNQSFYYYDTIAASGAGQKDRTFSVDNPQEHRQMLATLLKNSRFMLANRGHINKPAIKSGRQEISSRFYEGAVAGAVMIGDPPSTDEFKRQFDWPDAIIEAPFDNPNIGQILDSLNSDPARLRTILRNNAYQGARRHDWLYRIQDIFKALHLPNTEKMGLRARQLEHIAELQDERVA